MAKVRISQLPELVSASLDVELVGSLNGRTYKVSVGAITSSVVEMLSASMDSRLDFLEEFQSDFYVISASIDTKIAAATNEQSLAHLVTTASFNQFTQSYRTDSASFDSRIIAATNEQFLGGFVTTSSLNDLSTSVDGRLDTLESFSSSADNRYVLSGSITQTTWDNIANKPNDIISSSTQITDLGFVTGAYAFLSEFNSLTQSFNIISGSVVNIENGFDTSSYQLFTQSISDRVDSLEAATASYLTSLNGAISSSTQVLNGSGIYSSSAQLPSNLISGSSQISALGFITSSQTINTASFATTGSNSFIGSQTITGSLIVSAVAVVNGGITIPTGSILSLTSGSSISVDASGAITGSLTGSVFGIGNVAVFSQSVDSRIDTLEATIISGSPNYTQVLGNKISNITTTGVSIISGSITTTGNPIQIMVTGDANPTSTGWCRLQLYRGESAIGNIVQVENESNQNVPYCLNIIDTPSAGTYTYSMRTVSGIAGTFEFGEASGPLLTAVELKTNTNLPSTNNTFTGTNTFIGTTTLRGGVNIGTGSGDEGGEIGLALSQTNTTLTGSVVVDVWRDKVRIFEGGGNNRGAYLDIPSQSNSVGSEILTRASTNILATPIWTSAGTITFGATTTAPTKGTKTQDNISYRQLGTKQWEVVMTYFQTANTGAANGSGDYLFTLPNSLSFDTSLPSQQLYTANVGTSSWYNYTYVIPSGGGGISNGATGGRVYPVVYNSTQFRILTINDSAWVKWFGSGHFQLGDNPYVTLQLTFRFTSA